MLLCAALLTCGQTLAEYQEGDFIVRIGVAAVDPNDDSGRLRLNGPTLAGTRAYVDSGYSVSITSTWLFADHWGPAGELGIDIAFDQVSR
ncbi:OmpW family outer membrane protein [Microbulbifer epialgicus]|uniref:OmpW family outer membrane protein n=1 Tax=Microbulbifer epialgicus TaxID=393907 RepID=A0ABV4P054_9GAMM